MKSATAQNARKILRFLARRRDSLSPLLILTHDYPDPDSLASAYALQYLCEHGFGIESMIAYGGIVGRMENRQMVRIVKIPLRKMKPSYLKKFSHVALMDTQPVFKNNPFPENRRATIVVDQHPYVTKPNADLVVVDTDCGATSVILAQAILLSKVEMSQKVATALAYGILSDTLNLYRSGRPDVVHTYMSILPYCDLKALGQIQNPSRSRRFFSTLGRGIQNAMVRRGLIVSHLGPVESPDLVSQITDFLLTYKRMHWALCTGRFKGKLHVSLRISKTSAEAGEILRDVFGDREQAGGHGAIAGGSFTVGEKEEAVWQDAELHLVDRLLKRLRIPSTGEFYQPFR